LRNVKFDYYWNKLREKSASCWSSSRKCRNSILVMNCILWSTFVGSCINYQHVHGMSETNYINMLRYETSLIYTKIYSFYKQAVIQTAWQTPKPFDILHYGEHFMNFCSVIYPLQSYKPGPCFTFFFVFPKKGE